MKKISYSLSLLLFLLSVAGCTKTENKKEITDQTYIIKASNVSVSDITLTIKTSLDPEKSFTIPKSGSKDIYVHATAGEYVKFTVTKAACEYLQGRVSPPGLAGKQDTAGLCRIKLLI